LKGSGSNKVNAIAPLQQKPDVYAIHPDIRPTAYKDPIDNTAKKFKPFLARNYQVRGISHPTSVIYSIFFLCETLTRLYMIFLHRSTTREEETSTRTQG
jgi:hypothetical protein